MNGVHDLGGTDGLGPVAVEQHEPVWHADWEKAAFAMFPTNFVKGYFGVDEFRFGIEQMHPADYLTSRYYEHWLHTIEHYTVTAGAVDPQELEARTQHYRDNPDEPLPDRKDPDLVTLIRERQKQIAAFDHVPVSAIPPDAVTASGSGLDPYISPQYAYLQADRVASARSIPAATVRALIAAHTQGRSLGFLGEPRVSVLALDIALDQRYPAHG